VRNHDAAVLRESAADTAPVLVIRKARHATVVALNKVLRGTGKVEARELGHVVSILAPLRLRHRKVSFGPVERRPVATRKVSLTPLFTVVQVQAPELGNRQASP
jgi:hypothetical protein